MRNFLFSTSLFSLTVSYYIPFRHITSPQRSRYIKLYSVYADDDQNIQSA